jgi:hypothetical protein
MKTQPDNRGFTTLSMTTWFASEHIAAKLLGGVTVIVIVCGVVLRGLGMTRSLWLDETWLANSILQKSLHQTLYYPGWLQTSPPGFLILVRWTNHLSGLSNASLRIVPLVSGILALPCLAWLSWKLLRPLAATWAVALYAFSPNAIYYSHVLKQYSSELACSAALMTAVWVYLSHERASRFWVLLGVLWMCLLGAYGTVLFLPGLLLLLWPFAGGERKEGERRRATSRWWLTLLLISATFLTLFLVTIRPNRTEDLRLDQRHPRTTSISEILSYTQYQTTELSQELPIPPRRPSPVLRLMRRVLIIGVPFCIVCGIVYARGDAKKRRFLVFMCGCPLATAFVVDLFSIYPWRGRTLLLLLPCLVFPLGSCIEIVQFRVRHGIWRTRFVAAACALAIAVTCLVGLRYGEGDRGDFDEDMAGAIRYVSEKALPSDLIFVQPYAEEAWKLYSRMYGLPSSLDVRFGDTGWPCCARGKKPLVSGKALVIRDFSSKIPESFDGRIWILTTAKKTHWQYVGLDEPAFLRSLLIPAGCQQLSVESFTNVSLQLFSCDKAALLKLPGS